MKFRGSLCFILSALVLFVALTGQVYAAQSEWSPEIARKLMADDWELPNQAPPLILYGITVVKLEQTAARHLDLAFSVVVGDQDSEDWQVSTNPDILQFVSRAHSSQLALEANVQNGEDILASQTTAWIGTTPHTPATLWFKQDIVGQTDGNALFELFLHPIQINPWNKTIETKVVLDSLSPQGQIAQLSSTAWFEEELAKPVAVITVKQEEESNSQRRYFALFVSAKTVSTQDYPNDLSPVPYTDIGDLSRLFDQFLGKSGEPQVLNHQIKAQVSRNEQDFGYGAHYVVTLPEGLGMTLNASGNFSTLPTLMLGVYDTLSWSDRLTVYGSLLPIIWDANKAKIHFGLNYELGASFHLEDWNLSLAWGQTQSKQHYSAAIQYIPESKLGLETGIRSQAGDWLMWVGFLYRFSL